ncbi:MAG: DUF3786 domain-containing protein [Pseudomonadota bacterium]
MEIDKIELFRWADQLPAALWEKLADRPPEEAAASAGALWVDGRFSIPLLGLDYTIDPGKRQIRRTGRSGHRVSFQSGVVLLTTLAESKGVPPSGCMISPLELPGGRMFFTGAHALAAEPLAEAFENRPSALVERVHSLGGQLIDGADLAMRLPGLPFVPLYLLLWKGDEDAPARAVIGIDSRAHFHLDLAGVFALTNIMANRLVSDIS